MTRFQCKASVCGYGLCLAMAGVGCAASVLEPSEALAPAQSGEDEAFGHASLARDQTEACAGRTLRTRADVQAARDCRVIVGDLVIEPTGFSELGSDDLPELTKITGSLLVFGSKGLTRLELPALNEVGTEDSGAVLEIGFDGGRLQQIALPALRQVRGDFAIAVLPGLQSLQLSALASIDGSFSLLGLPTLVALDLDPGVTSERAGIDRLCRLPAELLPELAPADVEASRIVAVGCCTESALGCEDMRCDCD